MNKIWIPIIIILLIVSLNFAYNNYLDNFSNKLMIDIEAAYGNIDIDYDKSKVYLDDVIRKWEDNENFLAITNGHEKIDVIKTSFKEAQKLYELKEINLLKVELTGLKGLVLHLRESDKVYFRNVF